MRRNVLADQPSIDPRRFDDSTIAALHGAFPESWINPPDELIATMDNATDDRHVLATAIAADPHLVVTANVTDFQSPRYVTAGHVVIETPTDFLITVLDAHPDLVATVLLHLATRRRGVTTIADVLDQLARNHALQPFADLARDRLQ